MSEIYSEIPDHEGGFTRGWGSTKIAYNPAALEHVILLLKYHGMIYGDVLEKIWDGKTDKALTEFAKSNPVGMVKLMDIAKRKIEYDS